MALKLTKVFVYGTLKQGRPLHGALKDSKFLGEKIIQGYEMYNLGRFPCIIPGNGEVHGEVYEVNPEVLINLDFIEGVPHMYQRITVDEVEVYVWNGGPAEDIRKLPRVEGGVW